MLHSHERGAKVFIQISAKKGPNIFLKMLNWSFDIQPTVAVRVVGTEVPFPLSSMQRNLFNMNGNVKMLDLLSLSAYCMAAQHLCGSVVPLLVEH